MNHSLGYLLDLTETVLESFLFAVGFTSETFVKDYLGKGVCI